ncbi:hypothetical protein TNCV_2267691 [Trichonephila clavipes]|nr:hypothetical protein TNCV_2267691 [Trichonephila clavipes]
MLNPDSCPKRPQDRIASAARQCGRSNTPSHRAKPTKNIAKALGWEPLAYEAYSPDLAPSDYHLFVSLGQYTHIYTHWLTSASLLTKTLNLGLMTGWPQKTKHFLAWYSQIARKMGKIGG